MIKGIDTGFLPGEFQFLGRETGFVQEDSLGRETGFGPKTNEVAAEIKQIFET